MRRHAIERLGSLFLAIFSTGLAAQLGADGMTTAQWIGASLAISGSLALLWTVRAWPAPDAPERAARRR